MRFICSLGIVLLCLNNTVTAHAQSIEPTNRPQRQITLQDCVELALKHNLDIQVASYTPRISQYNLEAAYAYYDPIFTADASRGSSTSGGGFNGTVNVPPNTTKSDAVDTGFNGKAVMGMSYSVGSTFSHRYGSLGGATSDNYDTDVSLSGRQPLLRDSWIDSSRHNILISKKQIKIDEATLRDQIRTTVHDVESRYYLLIAARDLVKVREKALELADKLLGDNRKKIQVGTMAPLDEKQAESEAAKARADLMASQRDVLFEENRLKALITDQYEQLYPSELVPTEQLVAVPQVYSRQESWMKALELRPDFQNLKLQLEQQGIEVKYRKNQMFPALDLTGALGRHGHDGFFGTHEPGFYSTLGDLRDDRLPRWSAGIVLSVPLSRRAEKNNHRAALTTQEQLEARLRTLHQAILTDVEDAITAAESSYEQIAARKQASEFAAKALDAGQKKFDQGIGTSYDVLQLQRDYRQRLTEEISAMVDYNRALADLYYVEGSNVEKVRIKLK